MDGVQRITLNELNANITNGFIVGIIIVKQRHRQFFNKKNPGELRGVWSFTLRDSPSHYINVTCWGSLTNVQMWDSTFRYGDVVNITKPKINLRKENDSSEQFCPAVTSPYILTLNEGQSQISIYDGDDYSDFLSLLTLPTKPLSGFMTLSDIQRNGSRMLGEYVDILVAVRSISPQYYITTKLGKKTSKKNIVVIDFTHSGINITLWDPELYGRTEQWKSRETVLFIADVRVGSYQGAINLTVNSRTIITADPQIPETQQLKQLAFHAPIPSGLNCVNANESLPDEFSIRTIMSVSLLKEKMEEISIESGQFTALLYCFVTKFDVDGTMSITKTKCTKCNSIIKDEIGVCFNQECPAGSGDESTKVKVEFDIPVDLSDHTGTISNCRMSGTAAEKILNCTIEQYNAMLPEERAIMKWNYQLEICEVKVVVLPPSAYRPRPCVYLLHCVKASLEDVARNMPLY